MTTTVKIECDCGQRYAFDVLPVDGRMPSSVACPSCGVDGTALANESLAATLALQTPAQPAGPVRVRIATPTAPPPLPPGTPPMRPKPKTPAPRARFGGWFGKPQTLSNRMGSWLIGLTAMLAVMLPWGIGIHPPVLPIAIFVGVCGVAGGVMNVSGRAPLWAGAVVGLTMALGGYGTALWWIQTHEYVNRLEIFLAFTAGVMPGALLQYGIQHLLLKRAEAAA